MPKTNDAALAAFIARKAEIDAALDRIRAASDDHFSPAPRMCTGATSLPSRTMLHC